MNLVARYSSRVVSSCREEIDGIPKRQIQKYKRQDGGGAGGSGRAGGRPESTCAPTARCERLPETHTSGSSSAEPPDNGKKRSPPAPRTQCQIVFHVEPDRIHAVGSIYTCSNMSTRDVKARLLPTSKTKDAAGTSADRSQHPYRIERTANVRTSLIPFRAISSSMNILPRLRARRADAG